MAIDSSIALGVKPIQIDSPLNSLAQLYQLKNAQSQGQMNDLNMQERTRSIEDSNKLRDLYAQPGFDMSSPDSMRKVMGISPSQGMAMQKSQLDNRKTQGEIDKARAILYTKIRWVRLHTRQTSQKTLLCRRAKDWCKQAY
jgi:hypothetical protein